jgi:hypothetical protein
VLSHHARISYQRAPQQSPSHDYLVVVVVLHRHHRPFASYTLQGVSHTLSMAASINPPVPEHLTAAAHSHQTRMAGERDESSTDDDVLCCCGVELSPNGEGWDDKTHVRSLSCAGELCDTATRPRFRPCRPPPLQLNSAHGGGSAATLMLLSTSFSLSQHPLFLSFATVNYHRQPHSHPSSPLQFRRTETIQSTARYELQRPSELSD